VHGRVDQRAAEPMKLHVVSDLHLSVAPFELPATDADWIVLAGDIARPEAACAWAARLGKPALYVAGNHEFYGGALDATMAALRQHSAGTPIHVLEREALIVDGVRFLGTTLWSDFSIVPAGEREQAMAQSVALVRDFSRIRVDSAASREGRPFTPADSVALFERAVDWLAQQLAEPFDGPTVVITHHAPSPRSVHPRFAGSPLNGCFVSDVEHLMGGERARLWIHGHTHDSFDYTVAGTRVLCNPRGYAKNGINENALFDPTLVVTV
jgi:predicted phosphodiesterase